MLNRRTFVVKTASLAVAAHWGCFSNAVDADQAKRVPVVDTHLHCFAGRGDARFPYHPRGPYQPAEAATPEQLLKCMDEAGVDFSIVVHPEPYQDDHRYLEHCLEVGGERVKGTCLFFADQPGSLDRLAALVKRWPKRIVAARVHAYAPDRLPPFEKPELRALWKQATELGLALQLHFEPRYAPRFEPLIQEFSKTTVIVDHLGRPFDGTPAENAVVLKWSRLPNVVMKLSSLPEPEPTSDRRVAAAIKSLVEAYGSDRLIYGGGFGTGTTGASYRAYRERLRTFLTNLSNADQAKVLGGTATRLFGFA